MHTRISRFADQMMEAAVLVALLAIPLFFNPYSARIFEGEKAGLLRVLAAIAVTVWLIRFLEIRDSDSRFSLSFLHEQPIILAALLLGLITVIASFTSITPRLSLWGSYQRSQGLITTFGYLALFFATITIVRSPGCRRRLVTTTLVASGPIALLAVVQYAGPNPVPWRSLDPARVFGTLSNPIFLGAYLVMVIPLTLAQIVRYRFGAGDVRWGGVIAYAVLLVLQVAAAVFSGSRAPWIGIVAGAVLFLFLLALQTRRRRAAAGLLLVAVFGLIFLGVLNLPNMPRETLRNVPLIGRFEQALGSGSTQVRVLIWQSVIDRFANEPARLILGYGPESTHAALLPVYQPELRRLEPERLPDRAHNVFFQALVTTGLSGAAMMVFLFAALFYTGLRGLEWISTPQQRNQWLALTAAGVTLGLFAPRLVEGSWTFAGVGVGLGLMASLGTYLLLCLWRLDPDTSGALTDRPILMAAVLAALAGHLLEITFGIRVTATESLFWVLAGLLVALQTADHAARNEAPQTSTPESQTPTGGEIALVWDSEQAGLGFLGGLMLSTLAFGVFLGDANTSTSSFGQWLLLIGAWLLAGPLWRASPDAEAKPGTGWIYPLISIGWSGLFLAIRGLVEVVGGDALTLLNLYFIWLLLSLAVIAVLLPRRPVEVSSTRGWLALGYPVLGVMSIGLATWLVIQPLRGDIYLGTAQANASAGQWSQALAFYQQAATEAPDVDVYQQHLGEAYVTAARLIQDPSQQASLFQAGRQAFQQAATLNPAEGTHRFNLAHLHLLWAQATTDPAQQAELLNQAATLYEQAASQTPNDPRLLNEWGLALQAQGNADAALAKYRRALEVAPQDVQAYLQIGSLYQQSGKTEQARQMYQQAVELAPNRAEAYRALADLYRQAGRLTEAVKAQQRAAELRPTDYVIHQNLALLYRDLGQIQNAVAEARLALNYAPPERREALQSFIQSLLASGAP